MYEDLIISDDHNGTPGLRSWYGQLTKKISFVNIEFRKIVSINISLINLNIYFDNCTFCVDTEIRSVKNLEIRRCRFKTKTDLFIFDPGRFLFDHNTIYLDLSINGNKEEIRISNNFHNDENGHIFIRSSIKHLWIKDCHFNYIDFDTNRCDRISILNSIVDYVKFEVGEYPRIFIRQCIFTQLYFNENLKDISLTISDKSIITFLVIYGESISELYLTGCTLFRLQFEGAANANQIYKIQGVHCKSLDFWNYACQAKISFVDVTVEEFGTLSFINADMKEVQYINCKFSDAYLKFENSKIVEIFTAETDFPETVFTTDNFNKWSQAQLAFGQLANSYKSQGDTVRYLDYQARELYAHMKKLKFKDDRAGYINLWANYWSNNFGRNWIRCLLITIGFALVSFYFLVISLKQYCIGFPIHYDLNIVKAFFHFFNPIRSTETEKIFDPDGKKLFDLTFFSYAIDL
ncbi:MAG TPA: hypothetical protein VKR58_15085, partial [Aquella sp.]|nr:hypothetical protein [Aquella sp.]